MTIAPIANAFRCLRTASAAQCGNTEFTRAEAQRAQRNAKEKLRMRGFSPIPWRFTTIWFIPGQLGAYLRGFRQQFPALVNLMPAGALQFLCALCASARDF